MAFGIVSSSDLPTGLSSELENVVPTVPQGLSDRAKGVIGELIDKSRADLFQNPMDTVMGGMTTKVEEMQTLLTSISTGDFTIPSISADDATTFLAGTSISDLQAGISAFKMHTDRLSGVLKGQGINAPGLEEIVSIGNSMNNMANMLDGASGCLNIVGAATGLFSQEDVGEKTGAIGNVIGRIAAGVATIAEVNDALSNAKNFLSAILTKDSNFFTTAVEQLKNAALGTVFSAIMEDPCAQFIMNRTGMPDFLKKLQAPINFSGLEIPDSD